jgi:hypothetical protein
LYKTDASPQSDEVMIVAQHSGRKKDWEEERCSAGNGAMTDGQQ